MTKIWSDLLAYAESVQGRDILKLFENEERIGHFSTQTLGLMFDYSKTNIDPKALDMLILLAKSSQVAERRDAMFAGDIINETEERAVLHTALRNVDTPLIVGGKDISIDLRASYMRMEQFANSVRLGKICGQGGAFTDVVNIGIGGSDLGPLMASLALAPYHDGPRCHFVSNVDGAHIHDVLAKLNPETTLVIVASKTFITVETMTNAATTRAWMAENVTDTGAQFAALSTSVEKTLAFGIDASRVFGFEDWVGGRYSLCGPIGLSVMLAIGPKAFKDMLAGAREMDIHFCKADFSDNLPVLLALIGMWHNQFCGYATRVVLPYEQRLSRLPAYLQQLEMESNGKGVKMDGQDLPYHSGPVIWGEVGTNGQHAFYQSIHQGTRIIPCEFLVGREGHEPDLAHQHLLLVSNCLAQSEALMKGRSFDIALGMMYSRGLSGAEAERQARHRVLKGNRPSTTLVYDKLTPYVLGQIVALYEHRVFVEGIILGINSFDQWGVELGKELAIAMLPILEGTKKMQSKDPSTQALVKFLLSDFAS
ncbi:MAG: glucose-6-phosphate isomerase [Paracoccaceae bacterium]